MLPDHFVRIRNIAPKPLSVVLLNYPVPEYLELLVVSDDGVVFRNIYEAPHQHYGFFGGIPLRRYSSTTRVSWPEPDRISPMSIIIKKIITVIMFIILVDYLLLYFIN